MPTIEYRGPSGDPELRNYVEQRLLSWIGHVGRELPSVTVCLDRRVEGDEPRFRCRMVARPLRWASVAVAKTEADAYTAIDGCAERLASHLALARRAQTAAQWRHLGGGRAAVAPRSGSTRGAA